MPQQLESLSSPKNGQQESSAYADQLPGKNSIVKLHKKLLATLALFQVMLLLNAACNGPQNFDQSGRPLDHSGNVLPDQIDVDEVATAVSPPTHYEVPGGLYIQLNLRGDRQPYYPSDVISQANADYLISIVKQNEGAPIGMLAIPSTFPKEIISNTPQVLGYAILTGVGLVVIADLSSLTVEELVQSWRIQAPQGVTLDSYLNMQYEYAESVISGMPPLPPALNDVPDLEVVTGIDTTTHPIVESTGGDLSDTPLLTFPPGWADLILKDQPPPIDTTLPDLNIDIHISDSNIDFSNLGDYEPMDDGTLPYQYRLAMSELLSSFGRGTTTQDQVRLLEAYGHTFQDLVYDGPELLLTGNSMIQSLRTATDQYDQFYYLFRQGLISEKRLEFMISSHLDDIRQILYELITREGTFENFAQASGYDYLAGIETLQATKSYLTAIQASGLALPGTIPDLVEKLDEVQKKMIEWN